MAKSVLVGVTGSFGSGKTLVACYLKECGAKVIDADQITHQLLNGNQSVIKEVVKTFGSSVLKGKRIDRRVLGAMIFQSETKRKRLMKLLHPRIERVVKQKIAQFRRSKAKMIVIDAPLIIEAGWHRWLDALIVVKANQALQVKRIQRRMDLSKAAILRRLKTQTAFQYKLRFADYIIDNRKGKNQTRNQVQHIYRELRNTIK